MMPCNNLYMHHCVNWFFFIMFFIWGLICILCIYLPGKLQIPLCLVEHVFLIQRKIYLQRQLKLIIRKHKVLCRVPRHNLLQYSKIDIIVQDKFSYKKYCICIVWIDQIVGLHTLTSVFLDLLDYILAQ